MSITDRARARAEKIVRNARARIGLTDREADLYRDGFTAGARWAVSLPPTDEEVEAAARVLDPYAWESVTQFHDARREDARILARQTLTAAREAQR